MIVEQRYAQALAQMCEQELLDSELFIFSARDALPLGQPERLPVR